MIDIILNCIHEYYNKQTFNRRTKHENNGVCTSRCVTRCLSLRNNIIYYIIKRTFSKLLVLFLLNNYWDILRIFPSIWSLFMRGFCYISRLNQRRKLQENDVTFFHRDCVTVVVVTLYDVYLAICTKRYQNVSWKILTFPHIKIMSNGFRTPQPMIKILTLLCKTVINYN